MLHITSPTVNYEPVYDLLNGFISCVFISVK